MIGEQDSRKAVELSEDISKLSISTSPTLKVLYVLCQCSCNSLPNSQLDILADSSLDSRFELVLLFSGLAVTCKLVRLFCDAKSFL